MTMSVRQAQHKLVAIWLVGSGLPFLLLAAQTTAGDIFSGHATDVWGWLLPTLMPTLLLLTGVVTADALRQARDKRVDPFFYRLASGISGFYLFIVLAVLIAGSVTGSTQKAMEAVLRSNLFLGPLQGLCGGALGVFFARQKEVQEAEEAQ